MQQREQRRQLRHDGMIVIAGIGDQRLGQRDALSRDAAIDPGDIFRRSPRDIAERAAGLDIPVLPAHSAEPQLGAPLVVWRVLRIDKGRADGAASEQGLELEGRVPRICGVGRRSAGDRKRYR